MDSQDQDLSISDSQKSEELSEMNNIRLLASKELKLKIKQKRNESS